MRAAPSRCRRVARFCTSRRPQARSQPPPAPRARFCPRIGPGRAGPPLTAPVRRQLFFSDARPGTAFSLQKTLDLSAADYTTRTAVRCYQFRADVAIVFPCRRGAAPRAPLRAPRIAHCRHRRLQSTGPDMDDLIRGGGRLAGARLQAAAQGKYAPGGKICRQCTGDLADGASRTQRWPCEAASRSVSALPRSADVRRVRATTREKAPRGQRRATGPRRPATGRAASAPRLGAPRGDRPAAQRRW